MAELGEGAEDSAPEGVNPEGVVDATPAPKAGDPWYAGIQNAEIKDWVAAKGWKSTEALAQSAFHLEKMKGVPAERLVALPKNGDAEAWRGVYAKLGMPESPDKYEIEVPGDLPSDEGYLNWAREKFHELGLSASQVKGLTSAHNEFLRGKAGEMAESAKIKAAGEDQELKREWGQGYDRQVRMAKTAAQELGFTGEALDGLETSIGYPATMKLLAGLGTRMGEDKFIGGEEARQGFHGMMTPGEAQAALAAWNGNETKMKALMDKNNPGHKAALEERRRLFELAHPGD